MLMGFFLFAALLQLVGIVIASSRLKSIRTAETWPSVPATILNAEVESWGSDSANYSVKIRYEYKFRDEKHRGSAHVPEPFGSERAARSALVDYPVASSLEVRVNPNAIEKSEAFIQVGTKSKIERSLAHFKILFVGLVIAACFMPVPSRQELIGWVVFLAGGAMMFGLVGLMILRIAWRSRR